jgi:hypothetical protein
MINEPALAIQASGIEAVDTCNNRHYTTRLAHEGVRRVSQGVQFAACSANRRSRNSTLTRHLKSQ